MATKEKSTKISIKLNFGKKKTGKHTKSQNKHKSIKKYKGQGK